MPYLWARRLCLASRSGQRDLVGSPDLERLSIRRQAELATRCVPPIAELPEPPVADQRAVQTAGARLRPGIFSSSVEFPELRQADKTRPSDVIVIRGPASAIYSREGKSWRVRNHYPHFPGTALCDNVHKPQKPARASPGAIANRSVADPLSHRQETPCAAASTATSPMSRA